MDAQRKQEYLSIKDLQLVYSELFDARTKWRNIGLELGMNASDLEAIAIKYRDDPDDCFRELLSKWLKRMDPKPTWAVLVSTLKCTTVGFEQMSEEVQKNHLSSVSANHTALECMDSTQPKSIDSQSPESVKDNPQPEFTNSPRSECIRTDSSQPECTDDVRSRLESQSEHFRCPCSNCDLLTYLDKGCPKTTSCSYPYLPLSTLSEGDREDLIQKLSDDTANIIQCFADLLSNTSKSLKRRQITVTQLIKVSLDLGAYKSGRNQIPLLEEDQAKLEEATTIDGAFITLRKHMSFFNHEILGHIVEHLGDENDQRNFEEFCSQFRLYCQRKLFEAPPTVFHPSRTGTRGDKNFVVLGTQDLFDTLADVKAAQRKIASLLGLRASTVRLKKIDIGSVILVFSIPGILNIFPLKPATYKELQSCGYTLIVSDTPTSQASNAEHQDLKSALVPQVIPKSLERVICLEPSSKDGYQTEGVRKEEDHHSNEMGDFDFQNVQTFCIEAYLEEWIEESNCVNILVSGRKGTGKSTLVNGLVGIEVSPEEKLTLDPGTPKVFERTYKFEDTVLKIIEKTCLEGYMCDLDDNLQSMIQRWKQIDLFIFCIRMSEIRLIAGNPNLISMRQLSESLGSGIWKNALIILTFANDIVAIGKEDGFVGPALEDYFEKKVKRWEEKLHTVLHEQVGVPKEIADSVAVVPAGYYKRPQLHPDGECWISRLWLEALASCSSRAQPALIRINEHRFMSTDETIMQRRLKVQDNFLCIRRLILASKGQEIGATLGFYEGIGYITGLRFGIKSNLDFFLKQYLITSLVLQNNSPESLLTPTSTSSLNASFSRIRTCSFCGKHTGKFQACGSCKKVMYCNRECQKKDWKNHKKSCQTEHLQPKPCSGCEKNFLTLQSCPCHKAAYCSKECQRMDWYKHKPDCTAIKSCDYDSKPLNQIEFL